MQAASLTGDARFKAYGNLDIEITKDDAPWASGTTATAGLLLGRWIGVLRVPADQRPADLRARVSSSSEPHYRRNTRWGRRPAALLLRS